jgi:hypothetical protein
MKVTRVDASPEAFTSYAIIMRVESVGDEAILLALPRIPTGSHAAKLFFEAMAAAVNEENE